MEYQGKKLVEYKPTETVIFNPPKKMLVWDSNSSEPIENDVVAFITIRENFPVVAVKHTWMHCAEIPEVLATNRELAKWLAQGNGEMRRGNMSMVFTSLSYAIDLGNDPIDGITLVRKWSDTKWHKPTREYLGLEDK